MHKSEVDFLRELEQKAVEERRVVATTILPSWARGLGEWLVVNPWRVLIPLSVLGYLALHTLFGATWVELTLAIFGGFR